MPLGQQEIAEALDIARGLAASGIPIFIAAPNPTHPAGYDLPPHWQHTTPNADIVNQWRPGWALCAVGGSTCDFLDTDPRNGGAESREMLSAAQRWPVSYGRQATPSGGTHDLITPLGVGKAKVAQGVDLQGGRLDGSSRGFVFISPTVRASKTDGVARPYRWLVKPDLKTLAMSTLFDASGTHIAELVTRSTRVKTSAITHRPAEIFCDKTPAGAQEAIDSMLRELTTRAIAGVTSGSESWGGDFHERLIRIAYTFGGYVGSDYLSDEQAEQMLRGAIIAAGATPTAAEIADITSGLDLGAQEPIWVRRNDPPPVDEARPLDSAGVEPDVQGFAARLIDAADLDELADPRPLISDWLYADTTARLVGQPGSYKSFVALDMACCVALGRDWHGSATTASSVLYVVGEGLSGYKRRIKAWCVANGVDTEALRGRLLLTRGSILIGSPEWLSLAAWVTDHQVALVVLDTQAKATAGYDENSNTDQGKLFAHLDGLRSATGGTMLLLHHTGHPGSESGERGRGASAWRAAVDTELLLTKTGDRSAVLRNDRQKEAESGQEVVITLTSCEQSLCVQVSQAATKARHDVQRSTDDDNRQRIKTAITELLDAGDAATSANIAAAMHMRKVEVCRLLTQMSVGHDRELVEVDGPRRSKAYFIKDQTPAISSENFDDQQAEVQKSGNPFT